MDQVQKLLWLWLPLFRRKVRRAGPLRELLKGVYDECPAHIHTFRSVCRSYTYHPRERAGLPKQNDKYDYRRQHLRNWWLPRGYPRDGWKVYERFINSKEIRCLNDVLSTNTRHPSPMTSHIYLSKRDRVQSRSMMISILIYRIFQFDRSIIHHVFA